MTEPAVERRYGPPVMTLVVATVGRRQELRRLLDSVQASRGEVPLEVLVVDQNPDGYLDDVLEGRPPEVVRRIAAPLGLSRARNAGLREVAGELVAFPDDDCWFEHGYIREVVELMARNPGWDGLSCVVGPSDEVTLGRFSSRAGWLSSGNVWHRAMSAGIVLRKAVTDATGEFDETLGVGAGTPWGAGEESDYLLRALALGHRIRYEPRLRVGHPAVGVGIESAARARSYGRGMGRVLRKTGCSRWRALIFIARPAIGVIPALISRDRAMVLFRLGVVRGRLEGWRSAP